MNRKGRSAYVRLEKLGEGSYATVHKCRNMFASAAHALSLESMVAFCSVNGSIVALKEIKLQAEEGVPFTAIREGESLREGREGRGGNGWV